MTTRTMVAAWLACWAAGSALGGQERQTTTVLAKLQTEEIQSIRLVDAGPRQVVEALHERLAAHARREGYRLVWNVATPLPDEPLAEFGMEHGSLALLLEAAAGFADLLVRDSDGELAVRSRHQPHPLLETRRFPVRSEFWRSIRPRDPKAFFRQLGIDFPPGTALGRSKDREHLLVTHDAETLALIDDILQATHAHPCRWELQLILGDGKVPAKAPAHTLALSANVRATVRLDLGNEGDFVHVAAREGYWYRDSDGIRFTLAVQVVRNGRTTFRQDTTLALCHEAGTALPLGDGQMLGLRAFLRRQDKGESSRSLQDVSPPWPSQGRSDAAERLRSLPLASVQIETETIPATLRQVADVLRGATPEPQRLGIAYVHLAQPSSSPPARSLDLHDTNASMLLGRIARISFGSEPQVGTNGIVLYDRGVGAIPMHRDVYGPATLEGDIEAYARPEGDAQDHDMKGATDLRPTFSSYGVAFPPGARLDHATYAGGSVVVHTNTPENLRQFRQLVSRLDGGLSFQRNWHSEIRLVRLSSDDPEAACIRQLMASPDGPDRQQGAQMLASAPDRVVWSAWGFGTDGESSTCHFPASDRGTGDLLLATTVTDDLCSSPGAEVFLSASGAGGKRGWRTTMMAERNHWPERGAWLAFRTDSLDVARGPGDQAHLLMRCVGQLVHEDARQPMEGTVEDPSPAADDRRDARAACRRTATWDLLFMFGLAEAGDCTGWSGEFPVSGKAAECRERLDDDPDFLSRMARNDRQCRLRLWSDDEREVVECFCRFGETATLPLPGQPGRSIVLTPSEEVPWERTLVRWRTGIGWPRTHRLAVGQTVQLTHGLHAKGDVVNGWDHGACGPPCADAVAAQERLRSALEEAHRAVLANYGATCIPRFRLRDSPLPEALARLGAACATERPGAPETWVLRQPILFGYLPEGAERVPWPGDEGHGQSETRDNTGPCFAVSWDGGLKGGGTTGTSCKDSAVSGDDDAPGAAEPRAMAYRQPVPEGRATFGLRDTTLANVLPVLQQAYGVPLLLREQDGQVLVRATALAHTARFGVPRQRIRARGQEGFRTWLARRGVAFGNGDRAVYFRALDTVVARGRAEFLAQVGKALQ